MKPELLNGANLAFIGDAYYELYIRKFLLFRDITNQHDLHKYAIRYVSAKAHSLIVRKLSDRFTEEEAAVFRRGRNHKYHMTRKNVDREEYLDSSGFEAVIGYLYLKEQHSRLEELLKLAIAAVEEQDE
jgi:ribonuclease-3 family protein